MRAYDRNNGIAGSGAVVMFFALPLGLCAGGATMLTLPQLLKLPADSTKISTPVMLGVALLTLGAVAVTTLGVGALGAALFNTGYDPSTK